MQFGIGVSTHINNWDIIRYAEELDYDRAWAGDSQMIWSDCYATVALVAHHTQRIHIGTGVSITGTRIAPVTAHSIATVNAIAPGRTFLGLGTGHTAMRVMGQDPMRVGEFREYLRVVRALLAGQAVDYTSRGETREIEFLHRARGFLDLDHPIPIYVAASGPRALQATGEFGDGWITVGGEPEVFAPKLAYIQDGAARAGRTLPANFTPPSSRRVACCGQVTGSVTRASSTRPAAGWPANCTSSTRYGRTTVRMTRSSRCISAICGRTTSRMSRA
jgi:alkanesulfonate monooxygenase SsuD/methylene tetrahydromethanopterin reductase-like flavin-dependent oxidoreductase (luciferase family)